MNRLTPGQLRQRKRQGRLLQGVRLGSELSLREAARRSGLNQGYLHNLETGERGVTYRSLELLSRVYQSRLEALQELLGIPQTSMYKDMVESLREDFRAFPSVRDEQEAKALAAFLQAYRFSGVHD